MRKCLIAGVVALVGLLAAIAGARALPESYGIAKGWPMGPGSAPPAASSLYTADTTAITADTTLVTADN
jgi:hypothetical protein